MKKNHNFSAEEQRLINEYLRQKGYTADIPDWDDNAQSHEDSEPDSSEESFIHDYGDHRQPLHSDAQYEYETNDEDYDSSDYDMDRSYQAKSEYSYYREHGEPHAASGQTKPRRHAAQSQKRQPFLTKAEASVEKGSMSRRAVFIFLISSLLWWDLWFRIFVHKGIDFKGLLINLLFSLSLAFALTFIITLFPKRWWRRLLAVPLLVIMIFFCAQYIYNAFFRTLFTWFSMVRAQQVAEFAEDVLWKILFNIPVLFLAFLPLIIFFIGRPIVRFLKNRGIIPEHWLAGPRIEKKAGVNKHDLVLRSLFSITATIVSFTFAILFIHVGDRGVNSAYDLYFETNDPFVASSKIGLISAMSVDLRHFLFDQGTTVPVDETLPEDILIKDPEDNQDHSEPEPVDPSTDSSVPDQSRTEPTSEIVEPTDQVFPIDFEKIIANESNDDLRAMAQYFSEVEPSKTNSHTGMFKGYNLIFLTVEGHSAYSADPELTPTLWKMQEEGIKFKNFYNPVWGVSTSDGEYTGLTGLAPKPGVWSMVESAKKDMALVPGNMLRRLGYYTTAWHNHTYTYYGRDKSHPNLGYTYKGLGNGLQVKKSWPESDLEMMEQIFDEMTAKEPFHSYIMTVSGHAAYTFYGNYIASKNREAVKDLPYNEGGRAYMATQIEVDKAMEYLLKRLREKGIADRTLIVMNADHYPYGLDKGDYDQLAGTELEENFEIYRNSLIMYVDGMEPEVVDRVCFTLDILPTIYNLMGVPYDSRLLMGSDVFSERSPLAFFVKRSWITDKGRYNAVTKEFTPAPGVTLANEQDYIDAITHIVKNKFKYSAKILEYDYYKRILPDSIWDIVNKDSGY
ncbi:MAG: LTA synthase family protein [Saccharofermentanales bacterium]|jgi:lipoteichoic acid synthase